MIGAMVGAQVGSAPTMLGTGVAVAAAPASGGSGWQRVILPRRKPAGIDEDDEEALILLVLGVAVARVR